MARRSMDWRTLALLMLMYVLLIGNFFVYQVAPIWLPFHVIVSTIAIHLAFTIWHEAAHLNVTSRPVANHVVGILGMFPYMTPYFMQRWVHLTHHNHLNDDEDPNRIYLDGKFWTIPLRYPRALRYARNVMRDDPRSEPERIADAASVLAVAAVFILAWRFGMLMDVILLWLLPLMIAKLIMDWYINYLPHVGLPAHRFKGTRIVDVRWLTPLVLQHNYHAVHHLWPNLPWHTYRRVFRKEEEYLQSHDVPIESRLFGLRTHARVDAEQRTRARPR